MRPVAYKVRIEELLRGEFRRSEDGSEPSYLISPWGTQIIRARVMGTVVDKLIREDGSYGTITIDDGSGLLRVKVWGRDVERIGKVNIGDLVDVIGRVREFEGEVYLAPEGVIPISDPNWETVRMLELARERRELLSKGVRPRLAREPQPEQVYAEPVGMPESVEVTTRPSADEELKKRITDALREFPGGASSDELANRLKLSRQEVEQVLRDLLTEGRIYEPEAGKYWVV